MAFNDSTISEGLLAAPKEGFLAPDFELTSGDGSTYHLEDFQGRVVLLNFWGSYCGPCRSEMPALQKIYNDIPEGDFILLAVDAPGDERNAVQFVDEYQITFPVLFDSDGKVSRLYRVYALPTTFFIDRQGKIKKIVTGGPVSEELFRVNILESMEP